LLLPLHFGLLPVLLLLVTRVLLPPATVLQALLVGLGLLPLLQAAPTGNSL
jgi:hypothetical protein